MKASCGKEKRGPPATQYCSFRDKDYNQLGDTQSGGKDGLYKVMKLVFSKYEKSGSEMEGKVHSY